MVSFGTTSAPDAIQQYFALSLFPRISPRLPNLPYCKYDTATALLVRWVCRQVDTCPRRNNSWGHRATRINSLSECQIFVHSYERDSPEKFESTRMVSPTFAWVLHDSRITPLLNGRQNPEPRYQTTMLLGVVSTRQSLGFRDPRHGPRYL